MTDLGSGDLVASRKATSIMGVWNWRKLYVHPLPTLLQKRTTNQKRFKEAEADITKAKTACLALTGSCLKKCQLGLKRTKRLRNDYKKNIDKYNEIIKNFEDEALVNADNFHGILEGMHETFDIVLAGCCEEPIKHETLNECTSCKKDFCEGLGFKSDALATLEKEFPDCVKVENIYNFPERDEKDRRFPERDEKDRRIAYFRSFINKVNAKGIAGVGLGHQANNYPTLISTGHKGPKGRGCVYDTKKHCYRMEIPVKEIIINSANMCADNLGLKSSCWVKGYTLWIHRDANSIADSDVLLLSHPGHVGEVDFVYKCPPKYIVADVPRETKKIIERETFLLAINKQKAALAEPSDGRRRLRRRLAKAQGTLLCDPEAC